MLIFLLPMQMIMTTRISKPLWNFIHDPIQLLLWKYPQRKTLVANRVTMRAARAMRHGGELHTVWIVRGCIQRVGPGAERVQLQERKAGNHGSLLAQYQQLVQMAQ